MCSQLSQSYRWSDGLPHLEGLIRFGVRSGFDDRPGRPLPKRMTPPMRTTPSLDWEQDRCVDPVKAPVLRCRVKRNGRIIWKWEGTGASTDRSVVQIISLSRALGRYDGRHAAACHSERVRWSASRLRRFPPDSTPNRHEARSRQAVMNRGGKECRTRRVPPQPASALIS